MWKKILHWVATKGIDLAQPFLEKLIEKDKQQMLDALNQSDSKVIAQQLCDMIKAEIKKAEDN